jgi:hypothetical protein
MAQAWQQNAIARVREIEPNWRPKPSTHENVEGLIQTYEREVREAETRLAELTTMGSVLVHLPLGRSRRAAQREISRRRNARTFIALGTKQAVTRVVQEVPAPAQATLF